MAHPDPPRFPRAIRRFLAGDTGHTLLIHGEPGTGKTLFALRCLDVLSTENEVLYVSSRVNKATIAEMYLDDRLSIDETAIVDLSEDPFALPITPAVPFDKLTLDSLLEWIESVHDASAGLTIAFDSWGLIHQYLASRHDGAPDLSTVTRKLAALARQTGVTVLLVSEGQNPAPLRYIVDGVVAPQVTEDDRGRACRDLQMQKLRGIHIENRRQPFTLVGGRFQALPQAEVQSLSASPDAGTWQMRPNSKRSFSTGLTNLDPVLRGGYDRGTVVHLELGVDLPRDAWSVLTLPTIRNFLANEMCATVVPPREASPGLVKNDVTAVVADDRVQTHGQIIRTATGDGRVGRSDSMVSTGDEPPQRRDRPPQSVSATSTPPDRSDAGPAGYGDQTDTDSHAGVRSPQKLAYDEYIGYAERLRDRHEGPQLHVIGLDNVQQEFKRQLGAFANYAALHNDLVVLITKPGETLRDQTDRVADTHLKLERAGTGLIMYGENPLTPRLGIEIDSTPAIPQLTLLEMV